MFLWIACVAEPESGDGVSDIVATADETVPSVIDVSWTSEAASLGGVRWELDGVVHERSEAAAGTDHEVRVVGVPEGETVELELLADGEVVGSTSWEAPYAPFPIPEVTVSGALDGYVLSHVLTDSGDAAIIWDGAGRAVWYYFVEGTARIFDVELHEGRAWLAVNPGNYVDTVGQVHHLSLDGSDVEVLDIDKVHSAAAPTPEGGMGYITKQVIAGEDGDILYDRIEERDADGQTRVVFDLSEHFEPEALCQHWYMIVSDYPGELYDWTHANSLILSEDGLSWYIMVRHYDALMKVDRATGAIEWMLGGPYGEFAIADDEAFSHAHTTTVTADRLLVMDNGNHHDPPASRIVDYQVDVDARTVSATRIIPRTDDGIVEFLGDAKDAYDGGLILSWTTMGIVEYVDAEGTSQWKLETALGSATGRVTWMPSLDEIP